MNKIIAYTGDGQGKTTAAVGQAVRAVSDVRKVLFVFFNKRKFDNSNEVKIFEKLGIKTYFFASEHPAFVPETTFQKMRLETLDGLNFVKNEMEKSHYDMIVMDEILISIRDGFISEDELLNLLENRHREMDIVLTGRGITEKIKEKADLVSEIMNIKHPYKKMKNKKRIPRRHGKTEARKDK